jgi:hypothetical protein
MDQPAALEPERALQRAARAIDAVESAMAKIRGRTDYAGIRLVALKELLYPSGEHTLPFDQRVRLYETGHLR